jgi:hypothetical protein
VGATGRRKGGKDQDGCARTKIESTVRRWRKNLGPIFCRRPEGTEKIKRIDGSQIRRSERTSHRTLNPAQGLERGRDEGEVKVMTYILA